MIVGYCNVVVVAVVVIINQSLMPSHFPNDGMDNHRAQAEEC